MAKRRSTGPECFPDVHNSEELPRAISLQEIDELIEGAYLEILDRVNALFSGTGQGTTLQKNRGRLSDFRKDLRKQLGITKEGFTEDIATFGDLRRTGKKVNRLLRDSEGGRGRQDSRFDTTVLRLIREKYTECSERYRGEIARARPSQPVTPTPTFADTSNKDVQQTPILEPFPTPKKRENEAVCRAINEGRIESTDIFPHELHGYWDLDEFVEEQGEREPFQDEIPAWVKLLNEAEANRLAIILSESRNGESLEQRLHRFFGQTRTLYADDTNQRERLVRRLMGNIGSARADLKKWLERHMHHNVREQDGVYIKRPHLLRVQEQKQLVKPNLRCIVDNHFSHLDVPPANRQLIDIGTWNGEIPMGLQHHFGGMVGVEPHEKRFAQLTRNPVRNLSAVNTSMETILENPEDYNLDGDAILFSQVLQYLRKEDNDIQSLQWALRHLHENGICMIVQNDLAQEPASRAHMRKRFGAYESALPNEKYRNFFEEQGVTTRMMRPTLFIKAHTQEGKVAMRDLLRFQLPGDTRHNLESLDHYQQLIEARGGIYKHILSILVAYKTAASAPAEAIPRSVVIPTAKVAPKPKQPTRPVPIKTTETPTLEPLGDKLATITPAEVLAFLHKITDISWGDERKERELLETIDVPWSSYRLWRQDRHSYEAAVKVLDSVHENECVPPDVRIDATTLHLVLKTLRNEYPDEDEFKAYLRKVGLYSRFYAAEQKKKARWRKEEDVEPEEEIVVDDVEPEEETAIEDIEPEVMETEPEEEIEVSASPAVIPGLSEKDSQLLQLRANLINSVLKEGDVPSEHLLKARAMLLETIDTN